MANLLVLTVALLLGLLVLVAWYARARALAEAKRFEVDAARGREIESIAMDAAHLLGATLESLDGALAEAESAPAETQGALRGAQRSASALSALFHAARLYLQPEDAVVHGSAEGCVRVAVAVARTRGCGVSVRGEGTSLQIAGPARDACDLVVAMIEALRATLGEPSDYVEVCLDDDEVILVGGRAPARLPRDRAARLGWELTPITRGDRAAVSIRASRADHASPEAIADVRMSTEAAR